MFYKSKDDKVLFQCECGEYTFIQFDSVDMFDDGNIEYILTVIDCPMTFMQKLQYLFKREIGIHDLLLTKEDIQELKKVLKKL
jgi:hypothetical protein